VADANPDEADSALSAHGVNTDDADGRPPLLADGGGCDGDGDGVSDAGTPTPASDNGASSGQSSTPSTNADMRRRLDRGTAALANCGAAAAAAAAAHGVATTSAAPRGSTDAWGWPPATTDREEGLAPPKLTEVTMLPSGVGGEARPPPPTAAAKKRPKRPAAQPSVAELSLSEVADGEVVSREGAGGRVVIASPPPPGDG